MKKVISKIKSSKSSKTRKKEDIKILYPTYITWATPPSPWIDEQ